MISAPRIGGFRYFFSHFIVSIVGSQRVLDFILIVLLFSVAALFVIGQYELAAGLFASLFIIAAIVLMIRVVAELFSRAGIREEEVWFQEAFRSANYLLEKPKVKNNANNDL